MMIKYDASQSGNLTKSELAALMQELSGEMQAARALRILWGTKLGLNMLRTAFPAF